MSAQKKVARSRTGQFFLRCSVASGMFSHERGITVELTSGKHVVAFVDARDVRVSKDPRPGEEIEGMVKVSVIEKGRDSVVVDLPQPAISQGTRLEVQPRMLREVPA